MQHCFFSLQPLYCGCFCLSGISIHSRRSGRSVSNIRCRCCCCCRYNSTPTRIPIFRTCHTHSTTHPSSDASRFGRRFSRPGQLWFLCHCQHIYPIFRVRSELPWRCTANLKKLLNFLVETEANFFMWAVFYRNLDIEKQKQKKKRKRIGTVKNLTNLEQTDIAKLTMLLGWRMPMIYSPSYTGKIFLPGDSLWLCVLIPVPQN